jgi:transposase
VNTKFYRAHLMKEQLRLAIRTKGVLALAMLDGWLDWVQRCRIPAFVDLGPGIGKNSADFEAAVLNNLSNALIESTNTKIRVLHRMAFGFAKYEHLTARALLDRGGYRPPLPGRSALALAALS